MKKEWLLIGLAALILLGGEAAVDTVTSSTIEKLAQAIAYAEGFHQPGSLPARQNNPGDITDGHGNILWFASIDEGWNALRRQVAMMFDGTSGIYNASMTIAEVASHYAEDSANWARNVAAHLGVAPSTRLAEII